MYPELLPGGEAVLFNRAVGVIPSEWDIVVESLDTGRRNVVVRRGKRSTIHTVWTHRVCPDRLTDGRPRSMCRGTK